VCRARCKYSEERVHGRIVHLVVATGNVITAAAWMIDPAACAAMELGSLRRFAWGFGAAWRHEDGKGFNVRTTPGVSLSDKGCANHALKAMLHSNIK